MYFHFFDNGIVSLAYGVMERKRSIREGPPIARLKDDIYSFTYRSLYIVYSFVYRLIVWPNTTDRYKVVFLLQTFIHYSLLFFHSTTNFIVPQMLRIS